MGKGRREGRGREGDRRDGEVAEMGCGAKGR